MDKYSDMYKLSFRRRIYLRTLNGTDISTIKATFEKIYQFFAVFTISIRFLLPSTAQNIYFVQLAYFLYALFSVLK